MSKHRRGEQRAQGEFQRSINRRRAIGPIRGKTNHPINTTAIHRLRNPTNIRRRESTGSTRVEEVIPKDEINRTREELSPVILEGGMFQSLKLLISS